MCRNYIPITKTTRSFLRDQCTIYNSGLNVEFEDYDFFMIFVCRSVCITEQEILKSLAGASDLKIPCSMVCMSFGQSLLTGLSLTDR